MCHIFLVEWTYCLQMLSKTLAVEVAWWSSSGSTLFQHILQMLGHLSVGCLGNLEASAKHLNLLSGSSTHSGPMCAVWNRPLNTIAMQVCTCPAKMFRYVASTMDINGDVHHLNYTNCASSDRLSISFSCTVGQPYPDIPKQVSTNPYRAYSQCRFYLFTKRYLVYYRDPGTAIWHSMCTEVNGSLLTENNAHQDDPDNAHHDHHLKKEAKWDIYTHDILSEIVNRLYVLNELAGAGVSEGV